MSLQDKLVVPIFVSHTLRKADDSNIQVVALKKLVHPLRKTGSRLSISGGRPQIIDDAYAKVRTQGSSQFLGILFANFW